MLNIGLFLVMTGRQAGGPETYERCLVEALSRLDSENCYHTYCLDSGAPALLPPRGERLKHQVLWPKLRLLSTAVSLPLALLRQRIDLLHAPFTPPPYSPKPYVFTHHCFSTFNHPEFYAPGILLRLNALLVKGLKSATRTICVSESVRDLTAERFKLDRSRMPVVYNGIGSQYRPLDRIIARRLVAERYGIQGPFLLYVGRIESRKNIVRMLHAFDEFRREAGDPVKLVLAGRRSAMTEGIDATLDALQLREHVVEMGYVDHADLPPLFAAAEMFLFPSLWEGFGLPVVEAMACGTPVMTSNLSSLPEVSGDAALLVDPYRVEDMGAAMLKLWRDEPLRAELRERGLRNAQRFSWDQTARQTLAVYREAALG